jgi:GMP synthase-like glutamine amidotransferase
VHILVLQHVRVEHPGVLRRFLAEDGHRWTAVELDEGEALPGLEGVDALWVMGGPMDVWEEAAHPWLRAEKAFIREAVAERGLPFLGLCLGHQLLAEALGGACGRAAKAEVGVMDVALTAAGAESILFDGLPERFDGLQWHGAEVTRPPEGARVLATSPLCAVQAMQWGPRAFSAQFHVEIEPDTVDNWLAIPAYAEALRTALGPEGPDLLRAAAAARMDELTARAERVYINWMQAAAQA